MSAVPRLDEPWPIAEWHDDEPPDDVILFNERAPAAAETRTPAARATEVGIDAADLIDLVFEPLRMVVPDWIAEGTTIIASPPKVGKSCLVYQVVVEVAIGGMLFGRRVAAGSALYLALEDGRRRGQSRLVAALNGRTMPRGRLEVRWSARRIGHGLEEDLVAWLDAHPDASVVAIDTLQKVRPPTNGKRGAYELDVEDLGRLQEVFRDRRVALIVVHHSKKDAGDDFLASVSGTYGITGSADSIVVIKRKRLEAFGTILATGRDIAETELSVRFDGMTWDQAPPSLAEASFERTEILRIIEESGPIFPAAIATRTGQARTSVQNIVGKLVEIGAVARMTGGYVAVDASHAHAYELSPHDSSDSESHQGPRGHARAQARVGDRMEQIFAADEPEPEEVDVAIATAFPTSMEATA